MHDRRCCYDNKKENRDISEGRDADAKADQVVDGGDRANQQADQQFTGGKGLRRALFYVPVGPEKAE